MTEARICFHHVRKSFTTNGRRMTVLNDVDFTVSAGEFTAIVGPSGCGKSTLLNLALGFAFPDSGEVLVDGQPVCGPSPATGVVFQQYAIFPWLTVAENIAFGLGLRAHRVPLEQRRAIVERYVQLMDLRGFENAYPKTLSGGMKQRVAIARAYAVNPRILLMDEPFAALDAQTRDLMQDLLLRLHAQEKKTVLFITHSVEEAIFLSNRVVVLSARPATVREIIQVPLSQQRTLDVRFTTEFGALRHYVEDLLRAEQTNLALVGNGGSTG